LIKIEQFIIYEYELESNQRRNLFMPLFKKLTEEIQKVEFKEKVKLSLTESEKKIVEKQIIFESILDNLDSDLIEEQYKQEEK